MKRRTVILGVASTSLTSSMILGSGAFSQTEVDRSMSVQVAEDSKGYLGLVANGRIPGVRTSESGILEIDFTDPGLNADSTFQFGHFADNEDGHPEGVEPETTESPIITGDQFTSAFVIVNQSSHDQLVSLGFTDIDDTGLNMSVQVHDSNGDVVDTAVLPENTFTDAEVELEVGQVFGMSLLLDTDGVNSGDSFSAELAIDAQAYD